MLKVYWSVLLNPSRKGKWARMLLLLIFLYGWWRLIPWTISTLAQQRESCKRCSCNMTLLIAQLLQRLTHSINIPPNVSSSCLPCSIQSCTGLLPSNGCCGLITFVCKNLIILLAILCRGFKSATNIKWCVPWRWVCVYLVQSRFVCMNYWNCNTFYILTFHVLWKLILIIINTRYI